MRTLRFIVDGQSLRPDPSCDFSGLVPGSSGYLKATFSFSPEWDDCVKVVGFWQQNGDECEPQLLNSEGSCVIPTDALKVKRFQIRVLGRNRNNLRLITNLVRICQDGGR